MQYRPEMYSRYLTTSPALLNPSLALTIIEAPCNSSARRSSLVPPWDAAILERNFCCQLKENKLSSNPKLSNQNLQTWLLPREARPGWRLQGCHGRVRRVDTARLVWAQHRGNQAGAEREILFQPGRSTHISPGSEKFEVWTACIEAVTCVSVLSRRL